MSHPMIKTACVVAGFAVAALAATSAFAAKPLSVKQKNEMARAMARSPAAKAAAPKTTTKAKETLMVGPGGTESIEIPEELYNFLGASPDAKGHMRVRDTDASAQSIAASAEISNEK